MRIRSQAGIGDIGHSVVVCSRTVDDCTGPVLEDVVILIIATEVSGGKVLVGPFVKPVQSPVESI
ncbi:hypothetical protein ES703_114813 [subsurface metagenome]